MSKRAKSTILILLSLLLILNLGLVGCNNTTTTTTTSGTTGSPNETTQESFEPITIQFWNGWTGSDGELLRELVNYFNDNNKVNVTVEMDIMEFASLTEKMTAALLSNTAPALHLQFATGDYAVNGQVVAINDIFEKTSLDRTDFVPEILDQMFLGENMYGLPFQLTSHYLFWNKDIFAEAGLDPEKPPQTWDELYEYSKAITDPSMNRFGGGVYYGNQLSLTSLMLSFGGAIVGGEDVDSFTSLLTHPDYYEANLKALEFYNSFYEEGLKPNYSGTDEMFLAGTIGMQVTGAWLVAGAKEAQDLNWGISLLPEGPAGRVQHASPIAMIIMKGTEGRALEASYQFMEYWNNNLNNPIRESAPASDWCKVLGYQPYLLSVATDEEFISDPIAQVTNSYVDYVKNYYPPSFYKFMQARSLVLDPLIENIAHSVMTPEEALADAHKNLEELIASYHED